MVAAIASNAACEIAMRITGGQALLAASAALWVARASLICWTKACLRRHAMHRGSAISAECLADQLLAFSLVYDVKGKIASSSIRRDCKDAPFEIVKRSVLENIIVLSATTEI
jgi:hypothetical protein